MEELIKRINELEDKVKSLFALIEEQNKINEDLNTEILNLQEKKERL